MASILRSVFGYSQATNDPGPWGAGMVRFGNGASYGNGSYGNVSNDDAMRLSAVYACLRLLSEAIATMPLDTFVRSGGARFPYRPKPDYLSFQPPQGSRVDYLSEVMLSLLTDGNAFIATPRDDLGVPLTLVVIDPCQVKVNQSSIGVITYTVGDDTYDAYDIMHIRGMTLPGRLRGLSPLAYALETVNLGLAAQRFGAAFFSNGALPSGIIEAPGDFDRTKANLVSELWNSKHRGTSNAGKVGVLTGGAKFNRVSITPEEAQFLATRAFQVPDIARFFGVPPHLIADASNSTSWGTGLAEQNLAFGQFSLRPWVDRIEDAHGRLLTTQGLPQVFVKLNMDALLRAGTKERYDAYAVALSNGFVTINEVRRLEDLAPIPGGDAVMELGQALHAEKVAKLIAAVEPPAPAAPVPTTGGKP